MDKNQVAVVILNYNGKHFLEKFLPSILRHSAPHRVLLADNGSTDTSVPYVRDKFPEVELILNGGNFGYAEGYSRALKHVDAKYVVLLNSDVEVTAGWIDRIYQFMEAHEDVGACQPKILDYSNRKLFEYAGAAGGFIDRLGYPFCRGRIFHSLEEDRNQYDTVPAEVFWATGACLFLRKSAYDQAGGLDNSYFAHMEEIDLCWRLKNFGYKIFFHPQSLIYHIGGGTLNKYSSRKTFLNFRNNLTTLTKNHPPAGLFFKIFWRLILDGIAATKFLLEGQPKHFFAVMKAHFAYYRWIPAILKKRKQLRSTPGFKYSMSQIYKGNIVAEYFLRHKKKFSDLHRGFYRD